MKTGVLFLFSRFYIFIVMINSQAIGIFDSGVGGTSIFKEIHRVMPLEKTIYLADSQNAPYGVKSKKEILQLCLKNTDLLLKMGCKIIVVACNTATTNAIEELRNRFDIPFIGIEPALKPAALNSQKKSVAVLATKGTLSSRLFSKTSALYTGGIKVTEIEGKGLVEAIEAGKEDQPSTRKLLEKILPPKLTRQIDYLVLGCTHYPYLIPQLKNILPPHINIIDSGKAVAQQTHEVLRAIGQLSKTQGDTPVFYTNKNANILKKFVGENQYPVHNLDF